MVEMAKRQILPATIKFVTNMAKSINVIKDASSSADVSVQQELLVETSKIMSSFKAKAAILEELTKQAQSVSGTYEQAVYYRDKVFTTMGALREDGDKLETLVDARIWPLPTYSEMLFSI
jgi:glutamine synthetase